MHTVLQYTYYAYFIQCYSTVCIQQTVLQYGMQYMNTYILHSIACNAYSVTILYAMRTVLHYSMHTTSCKLCFGMLNEIGISPHTLKVILTDIFMRLLISVRVTPKNV